MGKKYVIIDAMNMFFRGTHAVSPGTGVDTQIGMAFHIILNCIRKSFQDYGADHIVFCLEGRSWRKSFDEKYKLNRKIAQLSQTEAQQENNEILIEAFNEMCDFIANKTNVTYLRCPIAEADDLIAFWIDAHPDDEHTIVSSDSDFYQLLAPNVQIYNGPQKFLLTTEGFFDEKGKRIIDKKTKLPKAPIDPEYSLFLKCIRGDKSDNIFSAYPGVREKGTKKTVGIREAFEDRGQRGYKWNNFMLQRWTDADETEHKVKDRYEHNKHLIDLRAQPDDVKLALANTIFDATQKEAVSGVGVHFMKFCSTWALNRIGDNVTSYAKMLNARYQD